MREDPYAFASLVDITDFETILRYYDSRACEISEVVLVGESVPLHRFAYAASTLASSAESRTLMNEWTQNQSFRTLRDDGTGPRYFARQELGPSQLVNCLYLPPAYLIQRHTR